MEAQAIRVRAVFDRASEIGPPAEREAFLAAACAGDPGLRREVDALLLAHDQAGSFLARPVAELYGAAPTPAAGAGAPPAAVPLDFLLPPEAPGSLGRLGHYDVLGVLGRGGFGIVLRAFDSVLRRVVAVKVLAPELAATSAARKRFLREARSTAAVRHENVVQVHAVEEQPLPYLVMELIPGETLQQRLSRTGPTGPEEVVRIGRRIAEGLAAAHANGLVHRDVKPANVLIGPGVPERVTLTDFGLARAADDASLSQSGAVAGTPMYMSPEQASGEALDPRSDLFSLGSVLYTMASGRPPFRAGSAVAVLRRVVEDTPRPIREVIPETPDWLCRVIEKLHAKDPAARFQTAREVADLLADCERQLAGNADLADPGRIPARHPARAGRPSRSRAAFAAGLMAVAVLGGIGAALAVRGRRPDDGAAGTDPAGRPVATPTHPPRAAGPSEPPPDGAVDLLALIDPGRDALQGRWEWEGEALAARPPLSQLQVPCVPPENYLLRAEVERAGGTGALDIGLIAGGRTACIALDFSGIRSGIAGLDGKRLRESDVVREGGVIGPGRTQVAAEVRGRRIVVRVGGAAVIDWEGAPTRLTKVALWSKTDGKRPYLGTQNAGFLFHRLELVPLQPPAGARPPRPPSPSAPFDADRARAEQAAWAEYLGVPVETEHPVGVRLRLVPPGEFALTPRYRVRLTRPVRVGVTEVTVGQFRAFVEQTGYRTDAEGPGAGGALMKRNWQEIERPDDRYEVRPGVTWRNPPPASDDLPVAQVSHQDAVAFCAWLGRRDGRTYRLPTEAEWVWACRAGAGTRFAFGDAAADVGEYAWVDENAGGQAHPVGRKRPNPWGLFDVYGNLTEHCADDWRRDLPAGTESDPLHLGQRTRKAKRGGSYLLPAENQANPRGFCTQTFAIENVGFRVACEVPE